LSTQLTIYPRPRNHRGVVPDMLFVATLQISYPVRVFILKKP
jgi:hypothetical protein